MHAINLALEARLVNHRNLKNRKVGTHLATPKPCHGKVSNLQGYRVQRIDDSASCGFRYVDTASSILGRRYDGWYLDYTYEGEEFTGETVKGVVLRVSARDGQSRYVAAIAEGYSWAKDDREGPCIVEVECLYDDEREAARAADGLAERHHEVCREYSMKSDAEKVVEENRERIAEIRDEVRKLIQEVKASHPMSETIVGAVNKQIRSLFQEKEEMIDQNTRLKDEFRL